MTLNLTLLHPTYVLQVSDRRITKELSGEIHPLANKNVIYLTRDGLVSICYSGPAYLEHVPTDTWIACKLRDEDMAPFRDGERRGVRVGPGTAPWLDIGQTVELLRRELQALNLKRRLDVKVAGWQKYKGGMRPICWGIEAKGNTATAENPLPRYWHYDKSPYGGRRYYLTEIPGDPGWLSQSELYRLVALLMPEAWSPEAAVQRLIWAIRYVANRTPAVGSDCMCILLPNPDVRPELFVRYEPVTEGRAIIEAGESRIEVPSAFTPWFVSPQVHAPPSIIVGGHMPFALGPIRLIVQAPPVPKEMGILHGFSTQRRPREPSLGV